MWGSQSSPSLIFFLFVWLVSVQSSSVVYDVSLCWSICVIVVCVSLCFHLFMYVSVVCIGLPLSASLFVCGLCLCVSDDVRALCLLLQVRVFIFVLHDCMYLGRFHLYHLPPQSRSLLYHLFWSLYLLVSFLFFSLLFQDCISDLVTLLLSFFPLDSHYLLALLTTLFISLTSTSTCRMLGVWSCASPCLIV